MKTLSKESEPIRSFIAVNLTEGLRQPLSQLQEVLRAPAADVSWVRPENLHLTLKFLGEVSAKRLDTVKVVLQGIARTMPPFILSLSGLGAFPNSRAPRVVWVGIQDGALELQRLQEGLETALGLRGFPREGRSYTPHLTLGRVRSPRNREGLAECLSTLKAEYLGGMQVERVDLMRSDLSPKGAIYTILEGFPLGRPET
ncbi:MAG: RNA 2',3'-cyclic phosphodiesterase [candidate division NC10 bacterium]|nr:RNA 2',3'-cyclic phosphodiesterase [candidate division NC10 bacterium]